MISAYRAPILASTMAKHGLNRDLALASIDVILGLLLERFRTKRTTAKAHVLPAPTKPGGAIQRFFSQTAGAYDQILRFLEEFPGVGDKQINASLATKRVIIPIMSMNNGIVIADAQSNQPNSHRCYKSESSFFFVLCKCGWNPIIRQFPDGAVNTPGTTPLGKMERPFD